MTARGLRAFIKSRLPVGVELYKHIYQRYWDRKPMQAVFSGIYQNNGWEDGESISGPGSTLSQTAVVRARLPALVKEINARSLLDAPCGDFNWMKETPLDIDHYIGADVVPDLIARNQQAYGGDTRSFVHMDLTQDKLPEVDLILCRDCLFHFSEKAIFKALRNFKASRSKYLLTTTFPSTRDNGNILTGEWRPINLEVAPFNLPHPLTLLDEHLIDENGHDLGKHLGLWRLDDIQCRESSRRMPISTSHVLTSTALLAVSLALIFAASYALFHLVEQPAQKWSSVVRYWKRRVAG